MDDQVIDLTLCSDRGSDSDSDSDAVIVKTENDTLSICGDVR